MVVKPELSIIIVNYKAKKLLRDCLASIEKCKSELPLEVIVSDNDSQDGTGEMIKSQFSWVTYIEGPNVGFSKGNNRARPLVKGELVLFLNPDTKINKGTLLATTNYLKAHRDVGALSCKLVLPTGEIDKDARRRFPTPGIAFARLILRNGKRYWYEDVDPNRIQEVEAIQGAFFLTWKRLLDKVGWFDEDYFFQGEDIDLCWKIRKEGLKIIYYPEVSIFHLKGATTGKSKLFQPKITPEHKVRVKLATVDAMETFFRKRLWSCYPVWFDWLVVAGIKIFKGIRWLSVKISFLA